MSILHKEIASIRQDYALSSLSESDVLPDPIHQFSKWFQEAMTSEVTEPTAMVLSTCDQQGRPSSRVVLLKDIKPEGLSFFTNYESRKGQELLANPYASVLFFWPELQRQVRIEAQVERLAALDSDAYFAIRPRGSQIGAIASPQSRLLKDRMELENLVKEVEDRFTNEQHIPRPIHWGGFLLSPTRVEFWQGRSSRLHDRVVYEKQESTWKIMRIAP
ncbi:pyridoxamine 5'-phosphate oxidase [Sphingobacterium sp. HJSM2_6]|uniref:pyridoxamine 5'-phosphate oxidase n=1 Tax=Sphingobacterium sp. HJSM2_6 TaxID=3366264 RepID=UPI003BCE5656